MLKRRDVPLNENAPVNTIIGRSTRIKGSLVSEESLRVDGSFEGEITTAGDIIVGATGEVEATVTARNCCVVGKLRGKAEITNRMEILAKGVVEGDIQVGELAVEKGAVFCGNCTVTKEGDAGEQRAPLE
ncbi:MAG: polymer-forming cytoskeletal protein [Thermoanaerobacteraceae bacterium]|nr:polymer-forming cytoskeletal protein [Thermoanaerobacteraceae bacterium]